MSGKVGKVKAPNSPFPKQIPSERSNFSAWIGALEESRKRTWVIGLDVPSLGIIGAFAAIAAMSPFDPDWIAYASAVAIAVAALWVHWRKHQSN